MSVTFVAQRLREKYLLDADALTRVRSVLAAGGLVVYPTDTVYGLAADPFQEAAVARLYEAKARPRDLAVSMAVPDPADIFGFAAKTPVAEAFVAKNLPGPYTVVLRATAAAPKAIVSRDGLLGLRVPDHAIARLLAKSYGPITSTSANRHGQPSPVTCEEARAQLGDSVDVYIDGGPATLGQESTIVDLTGDRAKVLRPGPVPKGSI